MWPWTLDSIHNVYSKEVKSIIAGRELPPGADPAFQPPEEEREEEEGTK